VYSNQWWTLNVITLTIRIGERFSFRPTLKRRNIKND
jgi:hypothetical protein